MLPRVGAAGSSERKGRRRALSFRRLLARLALVDEERDRRVEQTRKAIEDLEARLDIARLSEAVDRIQEENAALLRLLSGPKEEPGAVARAVGSTPEASVSRLELFGEVERGSRAEVIEKLGKYLPVFDGRGPVCDLGCGRGEFLELAKGSDLEAYGIDTDEASVAACRALGLEARQEDLFEHLRRLPASTLGGVFCSQVIEHLPPELIPELLEEVHRVLVPGGAAVFETPNPATFATHVHSFWRDPTHVRPVPEPSLSFAARTAGLVVEDVLYTSRVVYEQRLAPVRTRSSDEHLRSMADQINAIVERLNDLLYGYQDYALIARKPSA
jgi:O-antigen chain-terminating methyltransferase